MTRSILSVHGPEVAKKQFRANAKAQGLTFRAAVEARSLLPKPKAPIAPGMGRRTHAPMNHSDWNGRVFVKVGDDLYDKDAPDDSDVCNDYPCCEICSFEFKPPYVLGDDGNERECSSTTVLGSLLDIAKPARVKGIKRDFEVVDSVTRVIAFEDDTPWQAGPSHGVYDDDDDGLWEEWDEAYRECDVAQAPTREKKMTYSQVVGKGG